MKRWLARIGIGFAAMLVLGLLLGGGFLLSLRLAVPNYDGAVELAGLQAPVEILRDAHAVPHIYADSLADAAFGLGFAHATDRLWQMETARRFLQGRLAELFGGIAADSDVLMRGMGLYTASEEAVRHLSPDGVRVLEAYAAGVNAYVSSHRGFWPIEFVLAGDTPPEPWRPADSIAVLKGMAMQLSGNAYTEAARAQLIAVLGRRSVEDFFPPFSAAPLPAYLDEIYGAVRTGEAPAIPDITASDNWAVDGAHSVTGKPLLANDPHLGLTMPSVWYLAHLSFPDGDLVGGTLAGIPAVIAGRNRHAAWGETNTGPDTQDLYLERLNPDNRREYQVPGGFLEFDVRAETVKIRWGGERRVLLRGSRHGPIMPEASTLGAAAPPGYAMALSWTALAPDDTSFDALLGINLAKTASEMKDAAQAFVTPMQNIVYANDAGESGNIGMMLPGRVPMRSERNDSFGLVPAPGWDGRYDWREFIPPEGMVTVDNPPSGRVLSANNDVTPMTYAYSLTKEWDAPYRFGRIDSLLGSREKHSLESFKAIQTDIVDTYALELRKRLLAAAPFAGDSAASANMLAQWDGAMAAGRPAPLIFTAWARALARRIYGDELGAQFPNFWGYRTEFTLRVLDNVEGEQRWCDDRATPDVEDCASRIRLALADALAELGSNFGADPSRWRWGDAHKANLAAQGTGSLPLIGSWFNREIEIDGGAFTLLRADHAMRGRRPYAATHGPGYRGIYDLGTPDNSQFMISTGQSGNLFSPHYDDLMGIWARGDYIAIPSTRETVEKSAVHRQSLRPAARHP